MFHCPKLGRIKKSLNINCWFVFQYYHFEGKNLLTFSAEYIQMTYLDPHESVN